MRKMVSDIHSFMVWSLWSWELSLVNVSPNLIVAFFLEKHGQSFFPSDRLPVECLFFL